MIYLLIGLGIGLIVGWNLLPQPDWVLKLFNKAKGEVDNVIKK